MSLDAGEIAAGQGAHHTDDPIADIPVVNEQVIDDHLAALRPIKVVLDETGHVGAALKAAREALGLAEDDIAQVTRVRAAYIAAIEVYDFEVLPSRPFVVGYVRAYAKALGLESEAVVRRFHAEAPRVDGKLRAPGGVRYDAFVSIRWLMVVGAVVAAAVALWNVARRAEIHAAAPAEMASRTITVSRPVAGPAEIGAPLPTPPEATTPPVYQTPGLSDGGSLKTSATAVGSSASQTGAGGVMNEASAAPGAPFVAAGVVYGAAAPGSGVVLQARKATSLVVRGAGGAVYFARFLSPGEAWRAPDLSGLVADVGDPSSMEVFVSGASRGRLTQAQTPLSHLGDN
jgi:cytoskeleton protein RodZ